MVVVKIGHIDKEEIFNIYKNNRLVASIIDKQNGDVLLGYNEIDSVTHIPVIRGKRGVYRYGICAYNREFLKHKPMKYNTDKDRREARLKSKRDSYRKRVEQYRKDTDKSISALTKRNFVNAIKDFYSEHYFFNYLVTPKDQFSLDKHDSAMIRDSEMYKFARNQDKYQKQNDYSLEQCIQMTESYLSRLLKNDKPIYDNYYYCVHQSHYTNSYHAHILLNITDTSIINPYTFLKNKWHTKAKYQKRMVKKIYNLENLVGYLNEEHKRNFGDELNIVYQECNIDRNSLRVPNDLDLTFDLEYSLKTFTHPVTQIFLKEYGVRHIA